MRKESSDSVVEGSKSGEDRVARTTIFLTEALNVNLDLLAVRTGQPKGEILREALRRHLELNGCEKPDQKPKSIRVTY